jgi:dephospho-CoA kinase
MGKSTTAKMFRDEGCPVFDADAAVHALYEKGGEAVPIIRSVFPDAIKRGAVDRAVLGRYMRDDPLQLEVLESFIHPLVNKAREAFFKDNKDAAIVVLDVPLLFEAGLEKHVNYIVVVTAPEQVQRKRVLAREGMSPELFESLLSRQILDKDKRRRADALVFTDKGLENARKQVQKILRDLTSAT